MEIYYWTNFSKRKNSTKVPTSGTKVDVFIKEEGSIMSPTFACNGIPKNATYFYVSDYGRYYFVDNVELGRDYQYRFHCSEDCMASQKTAIGNTSANVEYTSSSSQKWITDPRNVPTKNIIEKTTNVLDLTSHGFKTAIGNGKYILGVAMDGGVEYLELSSGELNTVLNTVFSDNFITLVENQLYDLKSILLSCISIPYAEPTPIGVPGGFVVRSETILNSCSKANRNIHFSSGLVNISFPSDDHNLGFTYLDKAPYTMGALYLPYVGVVPLDVDLIAPAKSLSVDVYMDGATGDIIYRLSKVTGDYIATYSGNCASNFPISGSSYNALGAIAAGSGIIGGALQALGGAVSGNPALVASGAMSAGSSAFNMFTSMEAHTHTNGTISSAIGCAAGSVVKAMIFTQEPSTWNVGTEYKAVSGMPYYQVANISSLSGYVKCSGASVSITGFDAERDIINGYLNSGFYYE